MGLNTSVLYHISYVRVAALEGFILMWNIVRVFGITKLQVKWAVAI
jgi:hypothetical protein